MSIPIYSYKYKYISFLISITAIITRFLNRLDYAVFLKKSILVLTHPNSHTLRCAPRVRLASVFFLSGAWSTMQTIPIDSAANQNLF